MTSRIGAVSLGRLLPAAWRAGPTVYLGLADSIRLLVLDGRLPLDVRVPSERELAAALGVSRTTVTAAYERLREQGFLVSRQGAGSWTATPAGGRAGVVPGGPAIRPVRPGELPDGVVDLAAAALGAGPQVAAAYAAALDALPRHLPGIGYDVVGLPELREAIAGWYGRRGLPTSADDVVVTSGALHAITLAFRVLVEAGDRVLVDHPTYPNALESLRAAGGRPVPVGVGAVSGGGPAGWDPDEVAATFRQAGPVAGFVIPDFHNPTGACLPPAGREALVAAAAAARTTLVVDESLTELWFDAPPPLPVAALADRERVVSVGGLSKVFWGGLRIGWLRADRRLLRRVVNARLASDVGSAVVDQLAAVHLLTHPAAAAAVADRRRWLADLRDRYAVALRRRLPAWRATRPAGGLSLWARLDAPVSSAMAAAAPRHGLRLAPGPVFGLDGAFDRYLRIPLVPTAEGPDEVARRLAALRADVAGPPAGRGWEALPVA
ncbi:MAG: PLP-dependent aminotransferase family protein [Kineosporiaceae bacterium]